MVLKTVKNPKYHQQILSILRVLAVLLVAVDLYWSASLPNVHLRILTT